MIIVTGGAGFIGSNLIQQLNKAGERDILLQVERGGAVMAGVFDGDGPALDPFHVGVGDWHPCYAEEDGCAPGERPVSVMVRCLNIIVSLSSFAANALFGFS